MIFVSDFVKFIKNVFAGFLTLLLIAPVYCPSTAKRIFLRFLECLDEILYSPNMTTYQIVSLPNLHEPVLINGIP